MVLLATTQYNLYATDRHTVAYQVHNAIAGLPRVKPFKITAPPGNLTTCPGEYASKPGCALIHSPGQLQRGAFLPFPFAASISLSSAGSITFSPGGPAHLYRITPRSSIR